MNNSTVLVYDSVNDIKNERFGRMDYFPFQYSFIQLDKYSSLNLSWIRSNKVDAAIQ